MYTRWRINGGAWKSILKCLTYVDQKLVDELSAAWHANNAKSVHFLVAEWEHTLITDRVFTSLDANAIRRMVYLDLNRTAGGPRGYVKLSTFQNINKATEVFPSALMSMDFPRRNSQTVVITARKRDRLWPSRKAKHKMRSGAMEKQDKCLDKRPRSAPERQKVAQTPRGLF